MNKSTIALAAVAAIGIYAVFKNVIDKGLSGTGMASQSRTSGGGVTNYSTEEGRIAQRNLEAAYRDGTVFGGRGEFDTDTVMKPAYTPYGGAVRTYATTSLQ